nr:hypothetical protein [uncultured Dethiosulfovibrio sp.]
MAVRRVDTLGCHPLVLMQKLAAIGGLEILKEEKHTHDGVDYPYRIVAKVKDGLYVEAKDELYKLGVTPTMLPSYTPSSSTTGPVMPLEVDANHLANAVWSNSYSISLASSTDITVDALGMSALYSGIGKLSRMYGVLFPGDLSLIREGVVTYGKEDSKWSPPASCSPRWSVNVHTMGISRAVTFGPSSGDDVLSALDGTFGYAMNAEVSKDVLLQALSSSGSPLLRVLLAVGGQGTPRPLVISGTVFRVSSQVSGDSLVMPSEWKTLPCTPIIINNDAGLFFCYNAGSTYSGMVGAITIDTSKGNGIEGPFPAIYDSGVFCGVRATGGEKLHVLGSPTNPAGTITMQLFSPEVPIPVDSVSGGPVVTDLFAYNSEEIRGSVEGLLAARENLPVGSVGWLDGNRYRVHLPGRMLQIG